MFYFEQKISVPTTFYSLYGPSYCIVFSCVLVCDIPGIWDTHFMTFSMFALMFIQYTKLLVKSLIFLIPIWLLCNCSTICPCNRKHIIVLLLFMAMPSIIAMFVPNWPIMFHALFYFIFCVACPVLCMTFTLGGLHPVRLQPVYLLLVCILVYLLMYWWHAIYTHVIDFLVPVYCMVVLG